MNTLPEAKRLAVELLEALPNSDVRLTAKGLSYSATNGRRYAATHSQVTLLGRLIGAAIPCPYDTWMTRTTLKVVENRARHSPPSNMWRAREALKRGHNTASLKEVTISHVCALQLPVTEFAAVEVDGRRWLLVNLNTAIGLAFSESLNGVIYPVRTATAYQKTWGAVAATEEDVLAALTTAISTPVVEPLNPFQLKALLKEIPQ